MIGFLRTLVFQDFWWKLFSLALAVLVWVTVSVAIEKEGSPVTPDLATRLKQRQFYNLSIDVVSSTGDARNVQARPSEVEVTVQGDSKIIADLQDKDIRVMVDVTGVEPGPGLRRPLLVSVPPGITRVQVQPESVQLVITAKEHERNTSETHPKSS